MSAPKGNLDINAVTLKKITKWIADGCSESNVARNLGVHPVWFSRKKKDYPELQEAVDNGRAQGETLAVGRLWDMINDPKSKGHASSVFFYLKSRHNWNDAGKTALKEGTAPAGVKFELLAPPKATVNPQAADDESPQDDTVED